MSPREKGIASREQIAGAGAAALAVGAMGGLILGWLGWVNVFTALVLGFAVGSAALIASRRHRDVAIQGIAGGMALAGILVAAVLSSMGGVSGESGQIARILVNLSYWDFVAPALAAVVGAIVRFVV